MARIIQQQSDLRKEYKKYHNRTVIFKVFTGLCFVLWMLNIFVWHTFDPVFLVPTFFGAAGFELLSRYNENKADTLKAGIDGEEKTLRILDDLPDVYTIFLNFQFVIDGRRWELDHLIVGPNGIFIVETKNYKGVLRGNIADQQLEKEKSGHTSLMKNPVLQVEREVYLLRKALTAYHCEHFLQGILYFADPDFSWEVVGENRWISIIRADRGGEREIRDLILDDISHPLSPDEYANVIRSLKIISQKG